MGSAIPLIATKLLPPSLSPSVVRRPRLIEMLEADAVRRLVILSAPAGYGKTALLCQWAQGRQGAVWYRLDHRDRDFPTLALHLMAAFARQFGGFCDDLKNALRAGERPPIDDVLSAIVNELVDRADQSLVLILDGYHKVETSKKVNYTIDYLLSYLPSSIRLIVSCRGLPRLASLPGLKTTGDASVLGEPDLRFTVAETVELLNHLRAPIHSGTVEGLITRTFGWAIGLQLLARQAAKVSVEVSPEDLIASHAFQSDLADYFTHQVLADEPSSLQSFLISASILARPTAAACDALLGTSGGASLLQQVQAKGLFLNRLNEDLHEFHPLFREFLCRRVADNPDERRELHLRAARHYEVCGDLSEAADHYLEAEAYDDVARVISSISDTWLSVCKFDRVISFVGRLPQQVRVQWPGLIVAAGKAMALQGRFTEALTQYRQAHDLYCVQYDRAGANKVLCAQREILCIMQSKREQAQVLRRSTTPEFEPDDELGRADLLKSLSYDHLCSGDTDAARHLFESAIQLCVSQGDRERELDVLINSGAYMLGLCGEFIEALDLLQRAEEIALKINSRFRLADCYNVKATYLLFLGRYAEAHQTAQKALVLAKELASIHQEGRAMVCVAAASYMLGIEPTAITAERYRRAYDLAESGGGERLMVVALLGLSDLYRRCGDFSLSVDYANRVIPRLDKGDNWFTAYALRHLGAAQAHSDCEGALRSLSAAMPLAVSKYELACNHFWLAFIHRKLGNADEEKHHLRESLDRAAVNDYCRVFGDEPLASPLLLADALSLGIQPDYVRRMLVRLGTKTTDALLPELFGSDETSRLNAIRALGEIGDMRAVSALQAVVSRDKSDPAGAEALVAIRRLWNRPAPPLRVRLLGSFSVEIGDYVVDVSTWKRRKTISVLACLAMNGDKGIHREVLMEKLWPGMDYQSAHNNLRVTIHDLRQYLEPFAREIDQWRYVIYKDDHYSLSLGQDGWFDVQAFRDGVRAAEQGKETAEVIGRYEAALEFYRGDLLEYMPFEDWCSSEREELKELHLASLAKVAELYVRQGDNHSATVYCKKILAIDGTREDIHRKLIHIYSNAGDRISAIRQYRHCVRILREELGVNPGPDTRSALKSAIYPVSFPRQKAK